MTVDDTERPTSPPQGGPDRPDPTTDAIRDADVVRGAVALVVGALLLLVPDLTLDLASRIIGLGLLVAGLAQVVAAVRGRPRSWLGAAIWLAAAAVGVAVLLEPFERLDRLAPALGLVLAVAGVLTALNGVRDVRRDGSASPGGIVLGLVLATTGGLVHAFPDAMVGLAIAAVGAWWVIVGVVHLAWHLGISARPAEPGIAGWLRSREMPSADRHDVVRKLYPEQGVEGWGEVARFFALMALSTSIAALAVISDSTAVVIGAMLIAPLMRPIMGVAGAAVMGWPARAWRSGQLVLAGVVFAIGLAYLIARWLPTSEVLSSSQVTSRVSPTPIDLLIALLAGAAGAYAMSRKQVADSLPGVAIAVALVPPLSVVGVTLEAGALDQALGASLLFLTNFVAVVLAAAAVFLVSGFSPVARLRSRVETVRVMLSLALLGTLAVVYPLSETWVGLFGEAADRDLAAGVVQEWLGDDRDLESRRVAIDGDTVEVVVAGSAPPPSAERLRAELAEALGRPVVLELRVQPEVRTIVGP